MYESEHGPAKLENTLEVITFPFLVLKDGIEQLLAN
jgi:hypothetical protein